jgi:hypothetical protein
MFAQASTTLPYSSNVVSATLGARTHPWSVALDGDGGELLAKVGLTIGRLPIYKHVRLHVGAVPGALHDERAMLPVSWEAVGGPPIFPKMEGTLHVEPAGARATKITLNASYDPPLGKLGELIDRAVMHNVAQITMKDFIDRLAAALTAELRDQQPKG